MYTLRDYSECLLSIGNWRILQLLCKILYLNLKGADFFEYRYGDSPVTSQKSSTRTFLQQNPEIFLNSPHQLSSLPLQIFLFLNIWYAMVFCVAELLLYVYKGTLLPYPDTARTLAIEIIIIFLLAFIEGVRIFLGYKGNLAERTMALVFSVVLGIPVLFIDLFILLWQTYVLRIEVVLVSVALAFLGFEMIFSFAAIFTFKRHQTMLR